MPADIEEQLQILGQLLDRYGHAAEATAAMHGELWLEEFSSSRDLYEVPSLNAPTSHSPMRRALLLAAAAAIVIVFGATAAQLRQGSRSGEARGEAPTHSTAPLLDIALGDAIGHLSIPAIDLDIIVVAGTRPDDLKRGVGHSPDSPLPGQPGNAVISGHRTTYGAPFIDLDKLEPGDAIVADTIHGHFVYLVESRKIADSADAILSASVDDDEAVLTLVTCHPKYSSKQTLIVTAVLDASQSDPMGPFSVDYATTPAGVDEFERQPGCPIV